MSLLSGEPNLELFQLVGFEGAFVDDEVIGL